MFGVRLRNVFRSRWHALIWSAGVLLTAYCSVPAADTSPRPAEERKAATAHANPWAKGDAAKPD